MKRSVWFIVLALVAAFALPAQENARWGVEFNVVWPFVPGVNIYTGKATFELWSSEAMSGELTAGFLVRPGTRDDEDAEIFREFGIALGYRQYVWRGAHVELALYPSYAVQEGNRIDGLNYRGFALTSELYAGYRFNLGPSDAPVWYLAPQAGIGYTIVSDLGPASGPEAPFPALNLQVGRRF